MLKATDDTFAVRFLIPGGLKREAQWLVLFTRCECEWLLVSVLAMGYPQRLPHLSPGISLSLLPLHDLNG